MFIKNKNGHVLMQWPDTDKYKEMLSTRSDLMEYTGEIEVSFNGDLYEKGYAPVKDIDEVKSKKLEEITTAFDSEINDTGHIAIPELDGFMVDARRKDKQNLDGLYEYMTSPITYVGYDAVRPDTTREEIGLIRKYIVAYGQELYAKKWALEEAVKAAETTQEVEEIVW